MKIGRSLWMIGCLLLPVMAMGQSPHSGARKNDWKLLCRYADTVVRHRYSYRKRELMVETGTDRGGSVEGRWKGRTLKMLTLNIDVSNRDYVTHYILRSSAVVVVDEVSVSFNPITNTYPVPRQEKRTRFVIMDKSHIYQTNASGTHASLLGGKKRQHVLSLLKDFDKYRKILNQNKNWQHVEHILQ